MKQRKYLYFKHPISLRNSEEVGILLSEYGLKYYAQYIILLEYAAERYWQERTWSFKCTTNQLSTLLKCKPNKVITLLECFTNLRLTSFIDLSKQRQTNERSTTNQLIISCVKLPELLDPKLLREEYIREDKNKEEKTSKTAAADRATFAPSGAFDPSGQGELSDEELNNAPEDWRNCSFEYSKHFDEKFLDKHWSKDRNFYFSKNYKKPFHKFMMDSLSRKKEWSSKDEELNEYGMTKAEQEVADLAIKLFGDPNKNKEE